MRYALWLWIALGALACTSKSADSKPNTPALEQGPGALARPPSGDRLPDELRPPREE